MTFVSDRAASMPARSAPCRYTRAARGLACAWVAAMAAGQAVAQSPDAGPDPVLHIEAEAHSAPIRRLSVDTARGVVLTASDDRTARSWSLADGSLRVVLRPPVSEVRPGRLHGAALHRVHAIAAVAGSTTDAQGSG